MENVIISSSDLAYGGIREFFDKAENELKLIHHQEVLLKYVQRQTLPAEKAKVDPTVFGSVLHFSRTLSTIARLSMLRCLNVPEKIWKKHVNREASVANRDKIEYHRPRKDLPEYAQSSPAVAHQLWSHFDQLFPQSEIQRNISRDPIKGRYTFKVSYMVVTSFSMYRL